MFQNWRSKLKAARQRAARALDQAPPGRLAASTHRSARPEAAPTPVAPCDQDDRTCSAALFRASPPDPVRRAERGQRLLLWIDGVGGYLVCLGDALVLGQAVPGTTVDVPLQADISRRHARVVRCGEGYLLEAWQATRVNGVRVARPTLLHDQDEIQLAKTVRLQFRQPHALSASARLDFLSHHRSQPKADAVVLMAECCVLGPGRSSHVVCRDWKDDVVLYRRDHELMCRAHGPLEIDGRVYPERGPVPPGAHVCGTDFSWTLEALV